MVAENTSQEFILKNMHETRKYFSKKLTKMN